MEDFEDHIEKLSQENKELRKLQAKVSDGKHQYTIAMLGTLIETLEECIGKLIVQNTKNVYFDKDLGGTIASTIKEITTAFSKIKAPTVTVTPNISVDLKPVSDEISKQNKTIISLLEKIGNGNKTEELQRLIVAMVNKNNAFIEKGFEAVNYTQQLNEISEGVNKKQVEWNGKITKRTSDRLIEEFYIKPKT